MTSKESPEPASRSDLVSRVGKGAMLLGLDVQKNVRMGQTIWGAARKVDFLLTHVETSERVGIDCRFQASSGTAYEKIPLTLDDIANWPVTGLVVFAGPGFSPAFKIFLRSRGNAIEYQELDLWLRFYFGLELSDGA